PDSQQAHHSAISPTAPPVRGRARSSGSRMAVREYGRAFAGAAHGSRGAAVLEERQLNAEPQNARGFALRDRCWNLVVVQWMISAPPSPGRREGREWTSGRLGIDGPLSFGERTRGVSNVLGRVSSGCLRAPRAHRTPRVSALR